MIKASRSSFLTPHDPPQQHGVDTTSETDLPVDFYDRHTGIKLIAELLVRVDIQQTWNETVLTQRLQRLIAEVTLLTRIEDDVDVGFLNLALGSAGKPR